MGYQAGSGRSESRKKGHRPKQEKVSRRRGPETAARQASELRPLGMEAPIRQALAAPAEVPESVRGPHPDDRFAPLRAEHAEVDRWLGELRTFVGPDEERVARWDRIVTSLETHARAEEWELYPRLRRLEQTRTIAEEALEGHARIRDLARRIEAKQGDDPEYRGLLEELARAVREHVALEEQTLLPLALQLLGEGDVDELVAGFVRQRQRLEPAVADERIHPGPPGRRRGRSSARVHPDEE